VVSVLYFHWYSIFMLAFKQVALLRGAAAAGSLPRSQTQCNEWGPDVAGIGDRKERRDSSIA
jgi:hypothetical protein